MVCRHSDHPHPMGARVVRGRLLLGGFVAEDTNDATLVTFYNQVVKYDSKFP